jgi:hypothetical protein
VNISMHLLIMMLSKLIQEETKFILNNLKK